eukprot:970219-Pleurochrysis_carterae.AAC.3
MSLPMHTLRDPLYPKRRLVLAIAVACASSDLLLIPIVLVSDNEDTVHKDSLAFEGCKDGLN